MRTFTYSLLLSIIIALFSFSTTVAQTTFSPNVNISNDVSDVYGLAVGDLNDDGLADIVSASAADDKVAWYENLGVGNFSSQNLLGTTGNGVRAVDIADIDGDSKPDVLAASFSDGELYWYKNLGGGAFSSAAIITTSSSLRDVEAEDLDGDGDMDIVVTNLSSNHIGWHENVGGGLFATFKIIPSEQAEPRMIHIADLDLNGWPDVLSTSPNDNSIAWAANLGGGVFDTARIISNSITDPAMITTANLDGDTLPDILTGPQVGCNIYALYNLGGGLFSPKTSISTSICELRDIAAADFDNDGDQDIAARGFSGSNMGWFENQGGTVFSSLNSLGVTADGRNIVTADMDNDGDIDIVHANKNSINYLENLLNPVCDIVYAGYVVQSTDLSCPENFDGVATVIQLDTSYSYSYLWSTGSDANQITGLAAGEYTVTVMEAGGCTKLESVVVNDNKMELSFSQTGNSNYGVADGIMNVSVTGGTAPYSYFWTNGDTTSLIEGLVNGFYGVGVVDSAGCYTFGFDELLLSCPTPANPQTTPGIISAVLSWDGNPRYIGYEIKGRPAGASLFGSLVVFDTTKLVSGLSPSSSYEWQVRAKCDNDVISDLTPLMLFTTLSSKEKIVPAQVLVYPNPATTELHIVWPSGVMNIRLYDAAGKNIFYAEGHDGQMSVDIKDYAPGVYMIEMKNANSYQSSKVIIE